MGQKGTTLRGKKAQEKKKNTSHLKQAYKEYMYYFDDEEDYDGPSGSSSEEKKHTSLTLKPPTAEVLGFPFDKHLYAVIVRFLDRKSIMMLRLTCKEFLANLPIKMLGGDLKGLPVVYQGLKLCTQTVPFPLTKLCVDQYIVRTPGGLVGLTKVLNAHRETMEHLEFYVQDEYWRSIDYPVGTYQEGQVKGAQQKIANLFQIKYPCLKHLTIGRFTPIQCFEICYRAHRIWKAS